MDRIGHFFYVNVYIRKFFKFYMKKMKFLKQIYMDIKFPKNMKIFFMKKIKILKSV